MENNLSSCKKELQKKEKSIRDKTWKIKTDYEKSALDYCLEGLKGEKEKLLERLLLKIDKPTKQPDKSIEQLKKDTEVLQNNNASKYDKLPSISISVNDNDIDIDIESNQLFQKAIVGNENSTISDLIKKLNNSDWVKKGFDEYIPKEIDDKDELCPFCQKQTITKEFVDNISSYFKETYENDLGEIKRFLKSYENAINTIQPQEDYSKNKFISEKLSEFENLYGAVINCLKNNKTRIEDKIKSPSQKTSLDDSSSSIESFNAFIKKINQQISEHNEKINNKNKSLEEIKNCFWGIMRCEYDEELSLYQKERENIKSKIQKIQNNITSINNQIKMKEQNIAEQQKHTMNIEEAIDNINKELCGLGIDSFKIEKENNSRYKIVRTEEYENENTFKTLSEGEKMIISFLYFVELCKGKQSEDDTNQNKIVVIDDPISSLSHIYVFEIAQIIKSNFINKNNRECTQIFILTHSLYFFHELKPKKEKEEKDYKLFRLIKNEDSSKLKDMEFKEIQNDYQSYWQIIKDEKQPPALIANCMRNIIEYFFGFVEKMELKDVFKDEEFKDIKCQAFLRYMNRESHSDGINISDTKEFDYTHFKDVFKLVFEKSEYSNHYKKMIN
jgi:wobble nucleotide-excising tRNase